MKKSEQYKDNGLRLAVQRKNEAAERMTLSEDFTDRLMGSLTSSSLPKERKLKHRYWLYWAIGAVAASVVLLFSVGIVPGSRQGEKPDLVAQTDTIKTSPQTETKKVEEQPLEKKENMEMADTVRKIKEIYRINRPYRHYMAKAETAEITSEPDLADEIELAERAIAEEKRQIEMEIEMMAQMEGSMQANFESITKEIRQRGERMTQQVEIALSDDTY